MTSWGAGGRRRRGWWLWAFAVLVPGCDSDCAGSTGSRPTWEVVAPAQACVDVEFFVSAEVVGWGDSTDARLLPTATPPVSTMQVLSTDLDRSDDRTASFPFVCTDEGQGLIRINAMFFNLERDRVFWDETIEHPVNCRPCESELLPGVYASPVAQPFRTNNLGERFAEPPSARAAGGSLRFSSPVALISFGGEVDADDQLDTDGLLAVYDPLSQTSAQSLPADFYVYGAAGAQHAETGAAALLAYGNQGFALYVPPSPGEPFTETPSEALATNVRDAVHVGGGTPSDAIIFASDDSGVGFVRFDEQLGRFAISPEVLPTDQFFGQIRTAYADSADGPAVVLTSSSNSRLYHHPRGGSTTPTMVGAGIGTVVNGMRCLPPVCLVFVPGTTEVTVFLFDGQQVPTEAAPIDVGITPTDAALRLDGDGNVVALLTGSAGVVEAEIAPNGTLLGTTAVTVPGECSGPSGPSYVEDSAGFAALFTCVSSDNFVVARSSQP